jgi:hypothetical protein
VASLRSWLGATSQNSPRAICYAEESGESAPVPGIQGGEDELTGRPAEGFFQRPLIRSGHVKEAAVRTRV